MQRHAVQSFWGSNMFQAVKEFPAVNGIRSFINIWTTTWLLSLSWVTRTQSTPFHSISLSPILILSFHLRLGLKAVVFFQVSLSEPCKHYCSSSRVRHYPNTSSSVIWSLLIIFGGKYKRRSSTRFNFLPLPGSSSLLGQNISTALPWQLLSA